MLCETYNMMCYKDITETAAAASAKHVKTIMRMSQSC